MFIVHVFVHVKPQNIEDFKGRVGFSPEYDPEVYLRAQFMEKIRGIE